MKDAWKEIAAAALLGLALPGLILAVATASQPPETVIVLETSPTAVVTDPTESTTIPAPEVTVPILTGSRVTQMELNDYLVGVVLAEMPASFETEALKAQAVVARTYTMRSYQRGGRHDSAAVCTDPGCCQAYIEPEDYLQKGGTRSSLDKVREAVNATGMEVLTYEGALIEAVYFSCSGGSTEDAVAVWGTSYPYLQAVSSPGEEKATYYTGTVTYTAANFEAILGRDLPGNPTDWFGVTTYTPGGGVASMEIGGTIYKGTTLRSVLGLRSTAFMIDATDSQVTITTKGYGHRVGMSQYGADAMAVEGSDYRQILTHYYQGVTLTVLEN